MAHLALVSAHMDPESARQDAQRMFNRVLAAWASDVLTLRSSGLDRPCVRWSSAPAAPLRQRKAA